MRNNKPPVSDAVEAPADTRAVSITEYPDSRVRLEAGDESLNLSEAEFALLKLAMRDQGDKGPEPKAPSDWRL